MKSPIKAHGPNLICEKLADQTHKSIGGLHMPVENPNITRFRVVSVGSGIPTDTPPTYRVPLAFKEGDVVLAANAMEITFSGQSYYVISDGSIIGTVEESLVKPVTMGEAVSLLAH